MFVRIVLSLSTLLPPVAFASDFIEVARVRQVQCARDAWQGWTLRYLQTGVVMRTPTGGLEPEVYTLKEKGRVESGLDSDSRVERLCATLDSILRAKGAAVFEVDGTTLVDVVPAARD